MEFPRETRRPKDPENETVVFERGWINIDRGWFCKVTKQDHCVESFANTKRAALRLARRAWRKSQEKRNRDKYGYPRVCGE